jgi:glycosyltransferase involved in cell wall biosynthesis
MGESKWICAQIGAREHYAVPRALHKEERLSGLYTDFWAGSGLRRLARKTGDGKGKRGGALRSLAGRFHPELEGAAVESWNVRSLLWEVTLRKRKAQSRKQKRGLTDHGLQDHGTTGPYQGFIEVGKGFAERVKERLKAKVEDAGWEAKDAIFFAYDTGALEAMEWCQDQGIKCVLNQMDPNRVEVELVRAEEKRWPGWATRQVEVPEEYFRRREQEWALADRVVVNSEFCRDALIKQGVALEKLVVVPLCYERENETAEQDNETTRQRDKCPMVSGHVVRGPLKVLFLGQAILRKGIQYLIEAARKLESENIRFDVVGPIGILQEAIGSAPKNLVFHGRAARDQASEWYRQADIFILPTLSDGFALTQLEAMAYGLPVIATPCCGAVVTDEVDGFLVPPRDAHALAKALQRYLSEPGLLKSHQAAALEKVKQFTLARLAARLVTLEAELK